MRNVVFCLFALVFIISCDRHKDYDVTTNFIENDTLITDSSIVNDTPEKIGIKMNKTGGVYEIPCLVNGVKMNFIFDTGASDVCISLTEALFLYKNGYIEDEDVGDRSYSQVADGGIVENTKLHIKTIEIAGIEITDVDAIVVKSISAPLLLGQSAIQKIGRIEINGDSLFITGVPKENISKEKIITNIPIPLSNPQVTWWDKVVAWFGNEKKVNKYVNHAGNSWNNDMDELALLYCNKAIECSKRNWKPYALKGHIYYFNESYVDAIENYNKMIQYNKKKENFPLNNGDTIRFITCLERLSWGNAVIGHYDEALRIGQTILESNPNNTQAINTISYVYLKKGKYDQAERWAKKLLDVDKKKAYFRLAYLYNEQGRYAEAVKYYEKCLEVDSKSDASMNNLSVILLDHYRNTRYYEAVELKKQAARLGNKYSIDWLKDNNIDW